ncbi:Piriformospora indica-insensitive protein 2 [Morella rubra]|uniref:Piriformospora indica-insensitive protein 2 n=1 Tax=Morella rubra TaxID=262757 RepID=A0A6A1WBI4_9ROSI|nr:Piriformospora indica-insensitive protein 2 [Morella rubra]
MPPSSLLFLGFFVLAGELIAGQHRSNGVQTMMEEDEIFGLFEVLGALLEDPGWAESHPQPCTETPWPGIQCEIGEDPPIFHVTKIHIGPDIASPPCKPSANLSESLLKLPFLKTLTIFNCFGTSPVTLSPSVFGGVSSLEHLALVSNPALSGKIPRTLSKIASLRVLSLAQNNLLGEIPREITGLVNLEQLDLSYNKLSGEIPVEIGGLNGLTILDVSCNGIEGNMPSSLGQLSMLQKLDLSSNRFTGAIPPDLGKLNRLVLLDLSNNFINGPIPETLSGLEHLEYLIVDHNPINSGIPLFIGTLGKLKSLSLSGCGLTGPILNSISSLENLTALALDNNSLNGTIPPNLGALPNLDQLNLSHNQLSGQLRLPEDFIHRLGNRLDIRGNVGLCRSNQIYKNSIPTYLETPVCGPINGKTSADERPDDYERSTKPPRHHDKMISSASWVVKSSFQPFSNLVSAVCFLIFSL